MKRFFYSILYYCGLVFSYIFNYNTKKQFNHCMNKLYTSWLSRFFREIGKNVVIESTIELGGAKYISIGDNSFIGKNTILAAHDNYLSQKFTPKIEIGDNVNIGKDSNISCINLIRIGNEVRMGRKVMINDNSHGLPERGMMDVQPNLRPLYSKGAIVIEDNVWIGEMVCILSNVHIGRGAIIGAGSIVTKDVPAYSIAVGNPAKVVKQL